MASLPKGTRFIDHRDLHALKGVRMTLPTIRKLVARDEFPKPVQLAERKTAWVEKEIDDWMASKLNRK